MLVKNVKVFISHPMGSVTEDEALAIRVRICDMITDIVVEQNTKYQITILDNYNLESKSNKCPKASVLGQALELMSEADIIIISKEAMASNRPFGCMVEENLASNYTTKAQLIYESDSFKRDIARALNRIAIDYEVGDILVRHTVFRSDDLLDESELYTVIEVKDDGLITMRVDADFVQNALGALDYTSLTCYVRHMTIDDLANYRLLDHNYSIADTYERFVKDISTSLKRIVDTYNLKDEKDAEESENG